MLHTLARILSLEWLFTERSLLALPRPPVVLIIWSFFFFRLQPLWDHWDVNCLLAGSSRLTEENACSVLTLCSAFYMKRKNKQIRVSSHFCRSSRLFFFAIIIIIAFILVSYFWCLLRFFTCWNVLSLFVCLFFILRIHRDKSFHCDVCNVCLDKRLQGKHKCRPDSGHDECCICLEVKYALVLWKVSRGTYFILRYQIWYQIAMLRIV